MQKVKLLGNRMREYEKKHPFLIIFWSVLCTCIIIAGVMGIRHMRTVQKYADASVVKFSDKEFEKEMQKLFQKEEIYNSDLESLSTLEISDNDQLSDISALEKCKNLKSVSITNCDVSDISVIGTLNQIESIDFSGNNLKSLDGLENARTLKEVTLKSNRIDSMDQLYNLPELQKLVISVSYTHLTLPTKLEV